MVIVPHIAAVSYLDTMPFLYGIKHEKNFRAELSLSDFTTVISDFVEHKADIALVPVHVVPTLEDARIITEYCVGYSGSDLDADYYPIVNPHAPNYRYFDGDHAPLAPLLDLDESWAYAVWVAHKDVDLDVIEGLQYALTYGMEHLYEALLDEGIEDVEEAYDHLMHLDFLYDEQKEETLKKFWNTGLKVPLRVQPG